MGKSSVIVVGRKFIFKKRYFIEGKEFLAQQSKGMIRIFSLETFQPFALPLDYASFFVTPHFFLQKENIEPFYPSAEAQYKFVIASEGFKNGRTIVKSATLIVFLNSTDYITLNCRGKKSAHRHQKTKFCGFYFFGDVYKFSPFLKPYTTVGLDNSAYHGETDAADHGKTDAADHGKTDAADEILSQPFFSELPSNDGGCLPSCSIQ
jgi:hypothetical protein